MITESTRFILVGPTGIHSSHTRPDPRLAIYSGLVRLEPDVGDVGPADVRGVDDRRRTSVLDSLARVERRLAVTERNDVGATHDKGVGLVPQSRGSDRVGRRLGLDDRGVEFRVVDAAVVVGVDHATGLEQRVEDGTAVRAEPVGDPAWLAKVPGTRLVVRRCVAEVDEEAGAWLRLALEVDAARLQARLDRREDTAVDAVVGV